MKEETFTGKARHRNGPSMREERIKLNRKRIFVPGCRITEGRHGRLLSREEKLKV